MCAHRSTGGSQTTLMVHDCTVKCVAATAIIGATIGYVAIETALYFYLAYLDEKEILWEMAPSALMCEYGPLPPRNTADLIDELCCQTRYRSTIHRMIHKTFRVACDNTGCSNVFTLVDRMSTVRGLKTAARQAGWSISEAGHFCERHRA